MCSRFLRGHWVTALFVCHAIGGASSSGAPAPRVIDEFDVATDGDHILVPVVIGGRQHLFGVDTGASCTALDTSFRPLLGAPLRNVTVDTVTGEKMNVEVFAAPKARLGSQALTLPGGVALVDLEGVRQASGHDLYGIIGMDFLRGRTFRLDPTQGTLTFLGEGTRVAGDWVPVVYNRSGLPFVSAQIGGFGLETFLVDTGMCHICSTGDLSETTFRSLLNANMLRVTDTVALSGVASAIVPQRVGGLESLSLGRSTRRALRFGEARLSALGMWYWRDFAVTFDFRNDCLYLVDSPRADSALDGEPGRSGMYLERRDEGAIVTLVREKGPAADAGVKEGDVVVSLDDLDASSARLHVLRLRLMRDGAIVNLTVRRAKDTLKLKLKLDGRDRSESGVATQETENRRGIANERTRHR